MDGGRRDQKGDCINCSNELSELTLECQALQEYNGELEISRNHYVTAFDHLPVGHVILDNKGIIINANLTIAALMGMQVDNLIGMPLNVLLVKHEIFFFEHLRRCKILKSTVSNEFIIKTPSNNTCWVQVISVPFERLDHQCLCYNTVIIDISHQKRLEQELQINDRLNLVGEMAVGIAHEIRNPLTTVHGYLQLFKRKSTNPQEIKDFQLMLAELERANKIITSFLALAKNKKTEFVLKNINHIVTEMYPLIQAEAILTGKEIFLELLADLPELFIDKEEIRQVLFNLVKNGLQSMARGQITIRTFIHDKNVVVAVEDQGHGISDENKERIGTPFFTTRDMGTGLGLATCYSIMQRHHAKLDFTTSQYGTTFFLRFRRYRKSI